MKEGSNSRFHLSYLIHHSRILDFKRFPKFISLLILFLYSFQSICLSLTNYTMIFKQPTHLFNTFIRSFCEYVLFIMKFQIEIGTFLQVFVIATTVLYLFLISSIGLYISYCVIKKLKISDFAINYFVPLVYLHSFIFCLPAQNIMLAMITHIWSNENLRTKGSNIAALVICIAGTIINILIACTLYLTTVGLKSKDKFARLNNIWIFSEYIKKAVLPCLFWLSESCFLDRDASWYFAIFQTIVCLIQIFNFIERPPFFSSKINRIIYYSAGCELFISVWNIVFLICNNSVEVLTTGHFLCVIILVTPFSAKFFKEMIETKHTLMISSETFKNRKDLWAFQLAKSTKFLAESGLTNSVNRFESKDFKDILYKITHKNQDQVHDIISLGNFLYNLSLKRKLPSSIDLIISEILIKSCDCLSQGYIICNRVLNRKTNSYSENLTAYTVRGMMNDFIREFQAENSKLVGFMKSVSIYDELGEAVRKAIQYREKFYALIGEIEPSIFQFIFNAKEVINHEEVLNSKWNRELIDTVEEYPPLLRTFSFYKIFVERKHEIGRSLLTKYLNLMRKKGIFQDSKSSVYSDRNVFFVVGVENHNFGRVVNSTLNVKKIFGMQASDLLGKNISLLMSSTIANIHDSLLEARLTESNRMVDPAQIKSLAKHNDGYLIPVEILVTIYPIINQGLSFWGMVKPLSSDLEHVIINQDGFIEGITEGLKSSFLSEIDEKTHFRLLGKIYEPTESPKISLDFSKFKPKRSLRSKGSTSLTSESSDQNSVVESQFFMNALIEKCQSQSEFYFMLFSDLIKRNKISKYRCQGAIKEYGKNKIFTISMQRVDQRKKNTKTFTSAMKSEEFSNITENTRFLGLTRAINMFPGEPFDFRRQSKSFSKFLTIKSTFVADNGKMENCESDLQPNLDEEESKNLSEKVMQEKALMESKLKMKYDLEIQNTMNEQIQTMKYYKFYERYVVLIFLVTFLLLFEFSYLLSSLDLSTLKDQATLRLSCLSHSFLRGQNLVKLFYALYPINLYGKILRLPFDEVSNISVNTMPEFSSEMIVQNIALKAAVNGLTDQEKDYFFKDNIRMYVSNFHSILSSQDFEYVDSFTITNAIFNRANIFMIKYSNLGLEDRIYAFDFLLVNIMNDLWLKSIEIPEKLEAFLMDKVKDMEEADTNDLYILLTFLFCLQASTVFVLVYSYYSTVNFVENIVNCGNSNELSNVVEDLKSLKDYFNQKLVEETLAKKIAKPKSSAKSKFTEKKGNVRELKQKLLLKLIGIFIFTVIPCIILALRRNIYNTPIQDMKKIVQDLTRLNLIVYYGISFEAYLGYYYSEPDIIVENNNLTNVIRNTLTKLKNSVSVERGFSEDALRFMEREYCSHYVKNKMPKNCSDLYKNMGTKGIISTVIEAVYYQTDFLNRVAQVQKNPTNLLKLFRDFQNLEIAYLFAYGISSAINDYGIKKNAIVNNDMTNASQNVLLLIIPAMITGIAHTIYIYFLILKKLNKERKFVCFCVNLIPLEVIFSSKQLKNYLLREASKFHGTVKRYEMLQNSESQKSLLKKTYEKDN